MAPINADLATGSLPVGLKQAHGNAKAKPLLIWAVRTDRNTLRAACDGFSNPQDSLSGFPPVLVTDVADFASFSRLGWLVEYYPRLAGEGELYEERKIRFLARLYRGASASPVSTGLEMGRRRRTDDILRWVVRSQSTLSPAD